jgi:hypothetical protein
MRSSTKTICFALALIGALHPAIAGQKEDVEALYRLIITKVDNTIVGSGEFKGQRTDYSGKKTPKALVVCMNWQAVTPTNYPSTMFGFRTGSSGNPPPSVQAAIEQATRICSGSCRDACVLADLNGQNALNPPADWPSRSKPE